MKERYMIGIILGCLLFCLSACKTPTDLSAEDNYESERQEINVLSYNLYLRAPSFLFWNQQEERIAKLRPSLLGYDVLLLQEVFGEKYRQRLIALVGDVYPYHSKRLGGQGSKQDAGLLLMSRWPIEEEQSLLFGETCAGSDCLATKGAIYIKINKSGLPYHLFGTHLQANSEHQPTREAQLGLLADFVERQAISPEEAVLIGGDLNVDLFSNASTLAFDNMQDSLQAIHPSNRTGEAYPPSLDVTKNAFAKGARNEYLDYILYSTQHRKPLQSYNEVKPCKAAELDLSDHYAVAGYFRY
ncbi:MAG: sphingomyelin phosphodiesterase [Bacteroidota bacterium]